MSNPVGRRATGRPTRRWSPLGLAVLVVPGFLVAGLWTLPAPDVATVTTSPPTTQPLSALDLSCPTPIGPNPTLLVAQGDPAAEGQSLPPGQVSLGLGDSRTPIELSSGAVTEVPLSAAGVLTADNNAAPALVGAVSIPSPRAASPCAVPRATQWFSGLGASATHSSELELINPDAANAVADITVYGEQGIVDVPELRGVAVAAGTREVLKLAELLPQRGQLALSVTVARGRLGAHVVDIADELGEGATSADWSPAQATLGRSNLLLGLPAGSGQHRLVVANPSQDVAVVSVRIATAASAFSPTGLTEVQIPPESVGVIALTDVLEEASGAEAPLGLIVESTEPVAAALRSLSGDDLSVTGSLPSITEAVALVPTLKAKERAWLVVSGGLVPATGTVRFLAGDGAELESVSLDLGESSSVKVRLPPGTAQIHLAASPAVSAAMVLTGPRGSAILGLADLVRDTLVPAVSATIR